MTDERAVGRGEAPELEATDGSDGAAVTASAVRFWGVKAGGHGHAGEPARETAPHEEALQRAHSGDHAGAAELYASAVARSAHDVVALLGLGGSLLALGQYESAEREIRRALRVAPESAEVRLQLGVALHKRAAYPAAVAELRRTVELDPECVQAYLLLGETLNQLGEPADAIDALEQAVRLDQSPRAFYALGLAHDRKGEPERAGEMYRRSRDLST
jgi:tetratricopeptide (TPR) repeat protein